MSEHILDARGLICPLPVLKARKVLQKLHSGDLLRVAVTDPAAAKDFALFCDETGHLLQSVQPGATETEITLCCQKPA